MDGTDRLATVSNTLSEVVAGMVVQGGSVTVNQYGVPQRVPHQVPAGTPKFVARRPELGMIGTLLTGSPQDVPRITLVHGLPGIGKSAVVRRWVAETGGRFPGGELYLDFADLRHGVGGDVVEALGMALRSLGVADECLPASLAERATLFRDRTAGSPVLVVLDEVTAAAQVNALLPNSLGSAVLAISNARLGELDLDGADLLALEPLDEKAGLALLARGCGVLRIDAEPQAAARLVELCGGLPVALRVVAARLAREKRLSLSALVEQLADERERLSRLAISGERVVSMAFDGSYQALSAPAARLYRLLGLLPVRAFDGEVAALAGELDQGQTDELLAELVDAALLSEVGTGFAFHSLVRLHAAELGGREPVESQQALIARVVTSCTAKACWADRARTGNRLRIAPLPATPDPFAGEVAVAGEGEVETAGEGRGGEALDWLEAERSRLLEILRAAVAHGLDDEAWQLAEALTALYLSVRHLADWAETVELGAGAARRADNPQAEARLLSLGSRAFMDLGQPERARQALDRAAELAERTGNLVLRGSVQEFTGRYWDFYDREQAAEAYRRSYRLYLQAEEARGAALATFFLGCSRDAAGEHAEGLAILREALAGLLAVEDRRMAGRALAAIGAAQAHLGQREEAVRSLHEAVETLAAVKATYYVAQALEALADLSDGAQEQEYLHQAIAIYAVGGSPKVEQLAARLTPLE